jgi:hypothetical protein
MVAAPCGTGGHHVTATRNELPRQSGSEGGVGRPEVTRPEVLGAAWGLESVPIAGGRNRARARGIGYFFPDAWARPQREVEADRWAATARGAHQVVPHRERAGRAGS